MMILTDMRPPHGELGKPGMLKGMTMVLLNAREGVNDH
jgi:hypothetical protein